MTDLVITAANVLQQGGAAVQNGTAGVAVTAGQTLYKEAASQTWKLADSNSATVEAKTAGGIALNPAAAGQPVAVQTSGPIVIGGTLVAGSSYYLSETPGGIQPAADLGAGENVCQLGFAISTTVLMIKINTPGVTL